MAGSITVTNSSNFRGLARDIFREFAFTSDTADGSLPDQDIYGLDDCLLTEIVYDPGDAPNTPENTYEIRIVDKTTGRLKYLSGSIDATAEKLLMTTYQGNWVKIDGDITVKFVLVADHTSACDIGNSKTGVVKFRFEKKS